MIKIYSLLLFLKVSVHELTLLYWVGSISWRRSTWDKTTCLIAENETVGRSSTVPYRVHPQ